jgi:sugar lactone lactonase YvrE
MTKFWTPTGFARQLMLLHVTLTLTGCAGWGDSSNSDDTRYESGYRLTTLVPGGPLHGAKGIEFGPDGGLYVCSVYAQSIYRVDVESGAVDVAVGAPHGESDDVAFGPDGMMAWTALPSAELRAMYPGGEPFVVATKLPLINPVGFTDDGRMFAAQIGIDRFLEIDPRGETEPRLVAKGIGHLNSFEITAENALYGPLAGNGTLARIDLETGMVTPVAENMGTLSAVNLDSQGRVYAIGWDDGRVMRFDGEGSYEVIATLVPPLDNLAIDADDFIYVSLPARGAIVRIDPDTGAQTEIVPGNMGIPGGLHLDTTNGRETLIVADDFGFRHVDTRTGEIWATTDLTEFMDPNAASDVIANEQLIILSDIARDRVYAIDRETGKKTHKWRRIGKPYGLLLSNSGDPLVVLHDGGQIVQLSLTDRKARQVIATDLDRPVDMIAVDTDKLIVSEAGAGQITRIDMTTGSKAVVAAGLAQPEGIALLNDGRIAVAEVGKQRVIAVELSSGWTEVLADNLPIGLDLPGENGPVHVPTGLVADSSGAIYISSDIDHSLLKLTPVGS